VEVRERRLPNVITATAFSSVLIALCIAAWAAGEWVRLLTAIVTAASVGAVFVVLAFISPRGMGMGDVKFAPTIGLALGWLGPAVAMAGLLAGFFLAAVYGLLMLVLRRTGLKQLLPFGPALVLGSLIAMALAAT
ncbi:MAG: prepilin peptidase, partial [Agromyces sp.]